MPTFEDKRISTIQSKIYNVFLYGAVGDGVTDDSVAFQRALTAAADNNGNLYIPQGYTFVVGSLVLTSKSNFMITCLGTLKLKDSAPLSLIRFNSCTEFYIPNFNADGNIANNGVTLSEQIHLLDIRACNKVFLGDIICKDPPGDAVYIGGTGGTSNWNLNYLYATANDTGRNALSIISGSYGTVGTVYSYRVGTAAMPGGVDLEPNLSSETLKHISFDKVIVDSIGTNGYAVYNFVNATVDDISANYVSVLKRSTAATPTGSFAARIVGGDNISINQLRIEGGSFFGTNYHNGIVISDANHVNVNVNISGVNSGAVLATATDGVDDLKITGTIHTTFSHCIEVYKLTNSTIDCRLYNPATGKFCVIKTASSGLSDNVTFKGDYSKPSGGSGTRCVGVQSTGLVTDWKFESVDFSGWSNSNRFAGTDLQGNSTKTTCKGLNYGTAAPTTDDWSIGDIVYNTAPASAGFIGFVCTASGNPGTWTTFGAIT